MPRPCSDLYFIATEEPIFYTLPDGREITIPRTIFAQCGEILFNPSAVGISPSGALPNLVKQTLEQTPEEFQSILIANVLLCGGTVSALKFKP